MCAMNNEELRMKNAKGTSFFFFGCLIEVSVYSIETN